MASNKTYVYLEGTVVQKTEKAICFEMELNGVKDRKWFPKSVCEDGDDVQLHEETLNVEEWFCIKEDIEQ
jgi:hypothetical protein